MQTFPAWIFGFFTIIKNTPRAISKNGIMYVAKPNTPKSVPTTVFFIILSSPVKSDISTIMPNATKTRPAMSKPSHAFVFFADLVFVFFFFAAIKKLLRFLARCIHRDTLIIPHFIKKIKSYFAFSKKRKPAFLRGKVFFSNFSVQSVFYTAHLPGCICPRLRHSGAKNQEFRQRFY